MVGGGWFAAGLPEVGLSGSAPRHGFVVGMKVRVVVNFQRRGIEGRRDLFEGSVNSRRGKPSIPGEENHRRICTFDRMTSSTGVMLLLELAAEDMAEAAVAESGLPTAEKPKAYRRNMWAVVLGSFSSLPSLVLTTVSAAASHATREAGEWGEREGVLGPGKLGRRCVGRGRRGRLTQEV
jgi:hypothetical protein